MNYGINHIFIMEELKRLLDLIIKVEKAFVVSE